MKTAAYGKMFYSESPESIGELAAWKAAALPLSYTRRGLATLGFSRFRGKRFYYVFTSRIHRLFRLACPEAGSYGVHGQTGRNGTFPHVTRHAHDPRHPPRGNGVGASLANGD